MKTFALEDLPPEIAEAIAAREVEKAMHEDGFMTPVLEAMVPQHIKEHQDWFNVAQDLNKLAMSIWLDTKMKGHPLGPNAIAGRLMARATDTFAGTVILAQRGLTFV